METTMRLPLWLLRRLPMWEYFCPACHSTLDEKARSLKLCSKCGLYIDLSLEKLRAPPRFLRDGKSLSKYVHEHIFSKLNQKERRYLAKYFTVIFEDGFEGGQIFLDEYGSENARWVWTYGEGTGYNFAPDSEGGEVCAEHGITDESVSGTYSDSSLHSADYTLGPTDQAILKCRMKYNYGDVIGTYQGSRGFGFWDGGAGENLAWFWWACDSSSAELQGLRAQVNKGDVAVLNQVIAGIDMTVFHTYEIRFLAGRTEFYIDDVLKAAVDDRALSLTTIEAGWIDNGIYTLGEGKTGNLDVDYDQDCHITWLEYIDTGNFDEWDDTYFTAGETATVVTTDPHCGIYNAEFSCNGSSASEWAYALKTISGQATLFARAYLKFKIALPATGERYTPIEFDGTEWIGLIMLYNSAGTVYFVLTLRDGAGYNTDGSTTEVELDVCYCVELEVIIHGSAGEGRVYINGIQECELTGQDTDNFGNITDVRFGEILSTGTTAHDIEVDCVVVADVLTGPEELSSLKYPTIISTVDEDPYDDNDWVNPSNIGADDGDNASITHPTFDSPDYSYILKALGMEFAIPTGSTINGIKVEIERHNDAGETGQDALVQLTKDGTARVGDEKAVSGDWPTTPTIETYGGVADLWGAAWTVSEINASTFGLHFAAQATATNADIHVDYIRITVYYTEGEEEEVPISVFMRSYRNLRL